MKTITFENCSCPAKNTGFNACRTQFKENVERFLTDNTKLK